MIMKCGNCGSENIHYYKGDQTRCDDCGAIDYEVWEEENDSTTNC